MIYDIIWPASFLAVANENNHLIKFNNNNNLLLNISDYLIIFLLQLNYFFKHEIKGNKNFFLFFKIYIDIYNLTKINYFFLIKINKIKQIYSIYSYIFNFKRNNQLFMNLQNYNNYRRVHEKRKKTYSFITPGFFIKFFEKKKVLKKNKMIKLLMIKYFRKLLIVMKIKKLNLIVKKNPIFLPEMLNLFNQPILITIKPDKVEDEMDEKKIKKLTFNAPAFKHYIFLENKSYVLNKLKKKGRIKRKITKKIIKQNKILD